MEICKIMIYKYISSILSTKLKQKERNVDLQYETILKQLFIQSHNFNHFVLTTLINILRMLLQPNQGVKKTSFRAQSWQKDLFKSQFRRSLQTLQTQPKKQIITALQTKLYTVLIMNRTQSNKSISNPIALSPFETKYLEKTKALSSSKSMQIMPTLINTNSFKKEKQQQLPQKSKGNIGKVLKSNTFNPQSKPVQKQKSINNNFPSNKIAICNNASPPSNPEQFYVRNELYERQKELKLQFERRKLLYGINDDSQTLKVTLFKKQAEENSILVQEREKSRTYKEMYYKKYGKFKVEKDIIKKGKERGKINEEYEKLMKESMQKFESKLKQMHLEGEGIKLSHLLVKTEQKQSQMTTGPIETSKAGLAEVQEKIKVLMKRLNLQQLNDSMDSIEQLSKIEMENDICISEVNSSSIFQKGESVLGQNLDDTLRSQIDYSHMQKQILEEKGVHLPVEDYNIKEEEVVVEQREDVDNKLTIDVDIKQGMETTIKQRNEVIEAFQQEVYIDWEQKINRVREEKEELNQVVEQNVLPLAQLTQLIVLQSNSPQNGQSKISQAINAQIQNQQNNEEIEIQAKNEQIYLVVAQQQQISNKILNQTTKYQRQKSLPQIVVKEQQEEKLKMKVKNDALGDDESNTLTNDKQGKIAQIKEQLAQVKSNEQLDTAKGQEYPQSKKENDDTLKQQPYMQQIEKLKNKIKCLQTQNISLCTKVASYEQHIFEISNKQHSTQLPSGEDEKLLQDKGKDLSIYINDVLGGKNTKQSISVKKQAENQYYDEYQSSQDVPYQICQQSFIDNKGNFIQNAQVKVKHFGFCRFFISKDQQKEDQQLR